MATAIRVENVSKKYFIGHQREERYQYQTLRDTVLTGAHKLGKRLLDPFRTSNVTPVLDADEVEELWALKNIDFSVQQGDRVGIIGRNGAGKSTFLKILSRITAPTSGRVRIKGRVASLLEVGTGFHPELTGRENIYLNGAILGMTRSEIRAKFDEIVDFAEVERFLDTPVKRYSSGMYVRLAFAVAAHLQPETLIVDEVLAVGDAAFQKKCLGKKRDAASEGRTVLFVSHNMAAVSNLCSRAVVLERGKTAFVGDSADAISYYLESALSPSEVGPLARRTDRTGDGRVRIIRLSVVNSKGTELNGSVLSGDQVAVKLDYECNVPGLNDPHVAIVVKAPTGECYLYLSTDILGKRVGTLKKQGSFRFSLPKWPLAAGRYYVNTWVSFGACLSDWVIEAAHLDVEDGDYYGTGKTVPPSHTRFLPEYSFAAE